MKNPVNLCSYLGIMVLSLTMGCASAYHDYSECQVVDLPPLFTTATALYAIQREVPFLCQPRSA